MGSSEDTSKTAKLEKFNSYLLRRLSSAKLLFRLTFLSVLLLLLIFTLHYHSHGGAASHSHRSLLSSFRFSSSPKSFGGVEWEKLVRRAAEPRRKNGKSVLVTGAAGFVGTHCSLSLHRRGDGVLGLDNFNSYYDPSLKRSREALLASHGVTVIEGDINDHALLTKLFEVAAFTHVLHLAAQAGVRYAMKNPQSYVASNVAGFVNLLEVCKSAKPQPAIVWASSSSVYGLNKLSPFSESHRTDQPASLYAATKKAGEAIAHSYNHIYGLSLTGLRFFTVYGPWGRPDMAYFSFTKDILHGKPVTIYELKVDEGGRVEVARDFTYIDDVVRGCLGAIDTAEKSTLSGGRKTSPAQLRVYNLGNTSPVQVGKLVAILEELLGKQAKKKVLEMPSNGDVPYTHANVSLAAADFGYRPTTDLVTGLRKFVKWYVDYYGVPTAKSSGDGGVDSA